MTKNDNAVLVEGLTKLVDGATSLIAFLNQQSAPPEDEKPDVPAEAPTKEYLFSPGTVWHLCERVAGPVRFCHPSGNL